jgi:hypothetical protein
MNTNQQNNQMSNNQQIQQFNNLINQKYNLDTLGAIGFHQKKNINKMGWLISYCRKEFQDIKNFWYNKKEKQIYAVFYGDTCVDKHFNKKSYGCYVFKKDGYNHDSHDSIPYMIIDTGYFGIDWTKGFHKGTRYCIITSLIEYYQQENLYQIEKKMSQNKIDNNESVQIDNTESVQIKNTEKINSITVPFSITNQPWLVKHILAYSNYQLDIHKRTYKHVIKDIENIRKLRKTLYLHDKKKYARWNPFLQTKVFLCCPYSIIKPMNIRLKSEYPYTKKETLLIKKIFTKKILNKFYNNPFIYGIPIYNYREEFYNYHFDNYLRHTEYFELL